MEQHPDPRGESRAVGDNAVPVVEAEVACRVCGHPRSEHKGCGRDCQICGGDDFCLQCLLDEPNGDTNEHFFEP